MRGRFVNLPAPYGYGVGRMQVADRQIRQP